MDKIFTESGLRFDFTKSIDAYIADRPTYTDLSAVDFFVETENNIILVEVKNGDNKKATAESKLKFLGNLGSTAFPYQIGDKYKDMLLRKWSAGESFEKPIICVFIFEFSSFAKTDRSKLKEKIYNRIPFSLNKESFFNGKLIQQFKFLTIEEFKNAFPEFIVEEVA
jgi:hypothetical protein